MNKEMCPCCSGKNYSECCEPIIKGTRKAATPAELMRSRYSAYAKAEIDHIVESTHPSQRETIDVEEMKNWAERSIWTGIDVLSESPVTEDSETGTVEFVAHYTDQGNPVEHHELSEFRKKNGVWYFYDGQLVKQQPYRAKPKVERNAPCPCGSGKKYKKCCGR